MQRRLSICGAVLGSLTRSCGLISSARLKVTPLLSSAAPRAEASASYASVVTRSSAKKRFKVTGPFAKRKVVWHPRKLGGSTKIVKREKGHFAKMFPLGGL